MKIMGGGQEDGNASSPFPLSLCLQSAQHARCWLLSPPRPAKDVRWTQRDRRVNKGNSVPGALTRMGPCPWHSASPGPLLCTPPPQAALAPLQCQTTPPVTTGAFSPPRVPSSFLGSLWQFQSCSRHSAAAAFDGGRGQRRWLLSPHPQARPPLGSPAGRVEAAPRVPALSTRANEQTFPAAGRGARWPLTSAAASRRPPAPPPPGPQDPTCCLPA